MTEPNGVHVTQPPNKMEKMRDNMKERNKKPPIESKAVETGAWRYDVLRCERCERTSLKSLSV